MLCKRCAMRDDIIASEVVPRWIGLMFDVGAILRRPMKHPRPIGLVHSFNPISPRLYSKIPVPQLQSRHFCCLLLPS